MSELGFASVVLDVDSTLCGIEGIDWLAERRGIAVGARVAALTDGAMRGEIAIDVLYAERLTLVHPTRDETAELARAYQALLAPGAADAIRRLHAAGRRVVLVSGGVRQAILPVAASLGIGERDVHAVSLRFDARGAYAGHDASSPLTTAEGKRVVVASLGLPRRILAVGDGITDVAMRPVADSFAAFTGFVRREPIVAAADLTIDSFDQLVELALA